jgi:hypothetical protein
VVGSGIIDALVIKTSRVRGKVITFNHAHVCRPSDSRGDSAITQPPTRGLALAINSTVETEGSKHRALLSYEAAG